jgi:hypothetical protein
MGRQGTKERRVGLLWQTMIEMRDEADRKGRVWFGLGFEGASERACKRVLRKDVVWPDRVVRAPPMELIIKVQGYTEGLTMQGGILSGPG